MKKSFEKVFYENFSMQHFALIMNLCEPFRHYVVEFIQKNAEVAQILKR